VPATGLASDCAGNAPLAPQGVAPGHETATGLRGSGPV